jgi:hypothetical protein
VNSTTYFAAGSVIWTWLLSRFFPEVWAEAAKLTLATPFLVIPAASILGIILWSFEFEKRLIESATTKRLSTSARGKEVIGYVALLTLFLRPWESILTRRLSVEKIFETEIKNTLRLPGFRSDVRKLGIAFWFIISSFFLFDLAGFEVLNQNIISNDIVSFLPILWAILFLTITAATLGSKLNRANQLRQLAFFRWFDRTGKRIIRMQSSEVMDTELIHGDKNENRIRYLEDYLDWVEEILIQAEREDFEGFELGSEELMRFLIQKLPQNVSEGLIDNLVSKWLSVLESYSPVSFIAAENATRLTESSLSIISDPRLHKILTIRNRSELLFEKRKQVGKIIKPFLRKGMRFCDYFWGAKSYQKTFIVGTRFEKLVLTLIEFLVVMLGLPQAILKKVDRAKEISTHGLPWKPKLTDFIQIMKHEIIESISYSVFLRLLHLAGYDYIQDSSPPKEIAVIDEKENLTVMNDPQNRLSLLAWCLLTCHMKYSKDANRGILQWELLEWNIDFSLLATAFESEFIEGLLYTPPSLVTRISHQQMESFIELTFSRPKTPPIKDMYTFIAAFDEENMEKNYDFIRDLAKNLSGNKKDSAMKLAQMLKALLRGDQSKIPPKKIFLLKKTVRI